ncbi:hypothetical protein J4G33_15635 [Actinotalea sp. BY-33]|uniref:Sporulation protein n=1 Tax=Actinotalea soli TaxID=2819234 RepID=A0A939LSC3_9CELL|nr:spore germination protein GerW family protein [Actinotalea soli]MBO1753239.1 hypothetical protein [Actinotalea soli]
MSGDERSVQRDGGQRASTRARRRAGAITRVAGEALSVRRAFGEPVRHGEVVLVPVARVTGGTGSGWGDGESGAEAGGRATGELTGSGGGGGLGVRIQPVGAYVVRGASVSWQPALDLGRVVLGGQVVGAIAVAAMAWAWGRRSGR